MSKFNLFSLFIVVVIVVVFAEILSHDYEGIPDLRQQVFSSALQTQIEGLVKPQNSAPKKHTTSVSADTKSLPAFNTLPDNAAMKIKFGLIQQAGFQDMTLQRVPFNGFIFEALDLRDLKSVNVFQHHLLKNNQEKIATLYEFSSSSFLLSKEVYLFLKEKAKGATNASLNETNEFGDNSFYLNFLEQKTRAFLVVNQGGNVYAFAYPKEYHASAKMLLSLLPKVL